MCLPVLLILYNLLETQYQSVFSTVHYRPCSSTSYSLQSTTDTLPALRILYKPLPTKFKKGKRKVQGVPQSQTAALPRPQEEEETDKYKQVQTEQTYEKH